MEYGLLSFSSSIIDLFSQSKLMPDMGGEYTDKHGYTQKDEYKHKNRPTPRDLRSQVNKSMNSTMVLAETNCAFDLGNDLMEANFPYYHILQQAPIIRKRGKATEKTKGSQGKVKDLSKRDYERVHWNGKTFTKEYSKNVRGSRINYSKVMFYAGNGYVNSTAKQYLNVHYEYIDKICDEIAPKLAEMFGMKLMRKKDTGLGEEYGLQDESQYTTDILDIFESFE